MPKKYLKILGAVSYRQKIAKVTNSLPANQYPQVAKLDKHDENLRIL